MLVGVIGERMDLVGGLPYLSSLSDCVTTMGMNYYVPLLQNFYRRRCMYHGAEQLLNQVLETYSADESLQKLTEFAQQEQERAETKEHNMHETLKSTFALVEACQRGVAGQVSTGIPSLDSKLIMMPPDLVLLAARPSVGKTAFALWVSRCLLEQGGRVAFFSLEMSKEQLTMRWLSMLSGVSTETMLRRDGFKQQIAAVDKLQHAAQQMVEWGLEVHDGGDTTIADVRAQARAWHQQEPLSLVVVDYFQLLSAAGYDGRREQELAFCSRQLKALAKELNVPVLALCQMNRAIEARENSKNPNPRPKKSDLRETGQLEQDADVIMFLHPEDGLLALIEKQRMGKAPAEARLHFHAATQRFIDPDEEYRS